MSESGRSMAHSCKRKVKSGCEFPTGLRQGGPRKRCVCCSNCPRELASQASSRQSKRMDLIVQESRMTLSAQEAHSVKRAPVDDALLPVVLERWSPRSFDSRDVSPTDLKRMFEAARW